uniref:Ubiquitin carboxyl-terminal hydrolase n=1 Tax=Saccoglossus kowalevskii TaxID=10224 RepID=A0ABM0LVZ9_SACKO
MSTQESLHAVHTEAGNETDLHKNDRDVPSDLGVESTSSDGHNMNEMCQEKSTRDEEHESVNTMDAEKMDIRGSLQFVDELEADKSSCSKQSTDLGASKLVNESNITGDKECGAKVKEGNSDNNVSQDSSQSVYHVKWIKFKDGTMPIVTQNENGPCPLLAIINVLILKGQIVLPDLVEIVTSGQLMEYLGDCMLAQTPKTGIPPWKTGIPPWKTGIPPWKTGIPPWKTGIPPWKTGIPPWKTGIPPWKTGIPPWKTGIPPWKTGIPPWKTGISPWKTGISPWKTGIPPWKTGIPPWKTGISLWKTGIPSWKTSIPPWKTGIPLWKTGISSWKTGIPPWKTGIPPWKTGISPWKTGIPPWKNGIPPLKTGIPPWKTGYFTTMEDWYTTMEDWYTTMEDWLPPWKTGIPPWKTGIPPWKTGIPPWKTGIPPWKTGIHKTDIPPWKTGIPPWKTGIPPWKTGIPPWKTGIPPWKTGIPPWKTGIPPWKTGIPPWKTGIPPWKAGIPPWKTGIPPWKTGIPQHSVQSTASVVADFEYTPECIVFDLLNVHLFHGWLVDPQNVETVNVVGNYSYNQLVEQIIASKSAKNSDDIHKGLVLESFLESTASQLTYHGLCELNTKVKEDELCVFFRNNHFCTLYKQKGELFLLVTDQGFLTENSIVWETLANTEGDSYFVDWGFHTCPPADAIPPAADVSTEQQINQDYLVALSLQEEHRLVDDTQPSPAPAATGVASGVASGVDTPSDIQLSDHDLALQLQEEENLRAAQIQQQLENQQQQQQQQQHQQQQHQARQQRRREE